MKNKKGFSLTELFVVIALIAILVLIGYTSYSSITKAVKEKNYEQQISDVYIAARKYSSDTGVQRMYVKDIIDAGYLSGNSDDSLTNIYGEDLSCYYLDVNSNIGDSSTEITGDSPSQGRVWKKSVNSDGSCQKVTISNPFSFAFYGRNNEKIAIDDLTKWHKLSEVKVGIVINDKDKLIRELNSISSNDPLFDEYKEVFVYDGSGFTGEVNSGAIHSLVISNNPEANGTKTSYVSDNIYEETFTNVEGKLEFSYVISNNKDIQFTVDTNNVIWVDTSAPVCEVSDDCGNQLIKCTDTYSGDQEFIPTINNNTYQIVKKEPLNDNYNISRVSNTSFIVSDIAGNETNLITINFDNIGNKIKYDEPATYSLTCNYDEYTFRGPNNSCYKLLTGTTYGNLAPLSGGSWYEKDSGQEVASSKTIKISNCGTQEVTPKWNYTLTYDVNGGNSSCSSLSGVSGQKWIDSAGSNFCNPGTKSGYDFAGWYYTKNGTTYKLDDTTTVDFTGNITVTASWTKAQEITFTSYKKVSGINTYLLLDASFSTEMGRETIESAVNDLMASLRTNYNASSVNIVEFSRSSATKLYNHLTEYNFIYQTDYVSNLWQTDIKKAFELAFNDIKNYHADENNMIIIFSDGEPFNSNSCLYQLIDSRTCVSNYVNSQKSKYSNTSVYAVYFDASIIQSSIKEETIVANKNMLKAIVSNSSTDYVETSYDLSNLSDNFVNLITKPGESLNTTDLSYIYNIDTGALDYDKNPNVTIKSSNRTEFCSITSTSLNSNICKYDATNKTLSVDLSKFSSDSNVELTYWTKAN